MPNPFNQPGEWLRGNLHAHTTNSDGRLSPQEVVDCYAERGYDFVALTDHDVLTQPQGLNARGMTLIPGVEVVVPGGSLEQGLHVVALGVDRVPAIPQGAPTDVAVETIAAQAEVCFLAHPSWSLLEGLELRHLPGHIGVEVYNTGCDRDTDRANSESQWDLLLAHGEAAWGLAVDDGHLPIDQGVGAVVVRAEERTAGAILEALRQGSFYATSGPAIRGIERYGGNLRVTCSPCVEAMLTAPQPGMGYTTRSQPEQPRPFEEALLPVPRNGYWLRVAVLDAGGRKAWSNPFRLEELE